MFGSIYTKLGDFVKLGLHVMTNRCISDKTSLINTKLGNLVNLGVLFLTMWVNSC